MAGTGPTHGANQVYIGNWFTDASSLDIAFTNWGHLPGQGTEIVLDDVILNVVPEPGTSMLIGLGLIVLGARSRRTD